MEEDQELKHVCKFCSKSFGCGRSLGGHMRSHMINDITAQPDGTKLTKKKLPPLVLTNNNGQSLPSYVLRQNPKKTWRIEREKDKFLINNEKQDQEQEQEEQESWASVMDSHSDDNETTLAAPNRGKRSQRKIRQVMGTTNTANSSSSLCFANNNNNNGSSSISEIDQEQEEVAICLMMLSRDTCGFNSVVAESSDNNSVFLENNKKGAARKKKSQLDDESVVENSGIELGKRKFIDDCFKNSRFECTTCNKVFHSYQALGGHRASHRKNKGSIIDSSETVQQLSPDSDETKLMMVKSEKFSVDFQTKKSRGVHECPICFKIFPSGQALGGHKRSHLVAEAKNEKSLAIEGPIRDFLDLNLPAPCEEDSSNGVVGFDQWWNSKHESLLGLISK